MRVALLFLFMLMVASSAMATTFVGYVTMDAFNYIQDGNDAGDDSVYVETNTYTDSLGTASAVLTVDYDGGLFLGNVESARAGWDSVKISGESERRCLEIETGLIVGFQDIQFKLGKTPESTTISGPYTGGLAYVAAAGRPTFTRCKFDGGSVPSGDGGAIYLEKGAVAVFDSCQIYGAPLARTGHVMVANEPDSLIIQNCTISGVTEDAGSAFSIRGISTTDVLIYNSTFYGIDPQIFDISGEFNTFIIRDCTFRDSSGQLIVPRLGTQKVMVDSLYAADK